MLFTALLSYVQLVGSPCLLLASLISFFTAAHSSFREWGEEGGEEEEEEAVERKELE